MVAAKGAAFVTGGLIRVDGRMASLLVLEHAWQAGASGRANAVSCRRVQRVCCVLCGAGWFAGSLAAGH